MDVVDGKVRFRQAVEAVIRLVLAEDNNPDNLMSFALELDEVANKGTDGGSTNDWKAKMEEQVAPAIVQEMAVRRMQQVFRLKRAGNAVRFAKMVSDEAERSHKESPSDTNILNRGDMPAAG